MANQTGNGEVSDSKIGWANPSWLGLTWSWAMVAFTYFETSVHIGRYIWSWTFDDQAAI